MFILECICFPDDAVFSSNYRGPIVGQHVQIIEELLTEQQRSVHVSVKTRTRARALLLTL